MNLRILKVYGRGKAARNQRLEVLQNWMEDAGWQLMDFSPELGSAAFEYREENGPLPRFHGTRWLPGPDWYHPRNFVRMAGRVSPQGALAGLVGVAIVAGLTGLLFLSQGTGSLSLSTAGDAPAETWQYVDANMLNVRDQPLDSAQIVGVLYRNQRVEIKRVDEGWAEILRPERGFVAFKFLKTHPVQ